jgi:hypothetical protein
MALAWRRTVAVGSGPGASSTTNAAAAKRWFCQLGAEPEGQWIRRYGIPTSRAYRRAAGSLCPYARTMVWGWWNQIVTSGWTRSMARTARRGSGSDSGRGPAYSGSPGTPIGRHCDGKLRLRSTPRALPRVPRRRPSGLRSWTIHRVPAAGSRPASRRRVTAIPAGSVPWMQPTTRTERPGRRPRSSVSRIGRPWTEWPSSRDRRARTAGRAAGGACAIVLGEGRPRVGDPPLPQPARATDASSDRPAPTRAPARPDDQGACDRTRPIVDRSHADPGRRALARARRRYGRAVNDIAPVVETVQSAGLPGPSSHPPVGVSPRPSARPSDASAQALDVTRASLLA